MTRLAQVNPFFFIAAKPTGGKSMGVRQARSERALAEALRKERLVLLRTWKLPGWLGGEKAPGLKDHAELNAQLAQLLSRGVPLVEALEVAASVVTEGFRARTLRLQELVAGGDSFHEACRKIGGFDTVTIAVYRAAEQTGDLAGACERLAVGIRRQLAVRGKAATLMIYPAIVLTISVVVGIGMITFIVPMIGGALEKTGRDLPWFTVMLMSIGLFIRAYWVWLMLGVGAVLVLAILGRGAVGGLINRMSRRVPMLKDVVFAQESARFFSVMAAMTRSGIPLADALGVGVTAIGDPGLRRDLDRLRTRLIEGGVLRTLIDQVESMPLATRRLLIAADRAGDLEHAFDGLADDYQEEVDKRTSRVLATLEPMLIVFLFVIIGSLILSIMIPMMNMSGQGL
ncbi:MAG: type II secretion system protein GspF [Phycisphaeraceae bacterium]|nr:MAG: type II secretion system protein GspF [Phycisphaeraceae bacterium]